MSSKQRYVGIHQDRNGGMTSAGNLIRDAWVFGLLPEEESCMGWSLGQLDVLYDKVSLAWEPYGHLVSNLPSALRERHARIYQSAIERARAAGWDPQLDDDGE
jgi:hypothetical protein